MSEKGHEEKIEWMAVWAVRNQCQLDLEGECGLGRECVGILRAGVYPDYHWRDPKTYERTDSNGEVWTPPDAYHKHECVAVLGGGEPAEAQLYDWLRWFDERGFTVTYTVDDVAGLDVAKLILGHHNVVRMEK